MKKNAWFYNSETLGGYPALTHKTTKETCLFGQRGQIWEFSNGEFRAIVYMRNHSEKLVRGLTNKDLRVWVKRLEVPTEVDGQMMLASRYV